jgi:hypothetical protein
LDTELERIVVLTKVISVHDIGSGKFYITRRPKTKNSMLPLAFANPVEILIRDPSSRSRTFSTQEVPRKL